MSKSLLYQVALRNGHNFILGTSLEKRRLRLEAYLNRLLELEEYRNHSETVSKFTNIYFN